MTRRCSNIMQKSPPEEGAEEGGASGRRYPARDRNTLQRFNFEDSEPSAKCRRMDDSDAKVPLLFSKPHACHERDMHLCYERAMHLAMALCRLLHCEAAPLILPTFPLGSRTTPHMYTPAGDSDARGEDDEKIDDSSRNIAWIWPFQPF